LNSTKLPVFQSTDAHSEPCSWNADYPVDHNLGEFGESVVGSGFNHYTEIKVTQ